MVTGTQPRIRYQRAKRKLLLTESQQRMARALRAIMNTDTDSPENNAAWRQYHRESERQQRLFFRSRHK